MGNLSTNGWFVLYRGYIYTNKLTGIQDRINNKVIIDNSKKHHTMETFKYRLTVQHDAGKVRITTTATDEQAAKIKVMNAEGCPESAIKKVESKFSVSVDWGSVAGNPCTKMTEVFAMDHESAQKMVSDRVRKYKRCQKIFGGSCVQI